MDHIILSFLIARIKRLRFAKYNFQGFELDYRDHEAFSTMEIYHKRELLSRLIFGYNHCFNCLIVFQENIYTNYIKAGVKQANIGRLYIFNIEIKSKQKV